MRGEWQDAPRCRPIAFAKPRKQGPLFLRQTEKLCSDIAICQVAGPSPNILVINRCLLVLLLRRETERSVGVCHVVQAEPGPGSGV